MGALDQFFDEQKDTLDVSNIIASDIGEMEGNFAGDCLYKYFSSERRSFIDKPQIRFTQKTALNDPFELTKRWKDFGEPFASEAFIDYARRGVLRAFDNKDLIVAMLKEEFLKQGIVLTPIQVGLASGFLLSPAGKAFLAKQRVVAEAMIAPMMELMSAQLKLKADDLIDGITADLGIFSTSETAINALMWAHYASSGAGFVVGFNPTDRFFRTAGGQEKNLSLFRKVKYTDERISNFWSNPYYLFLVKNEKWAYEREWRMIKKLTECDEKKMVAEESVCLCNVRPGMMKSVIFGYNYDKKSLSNDAEKVLRFDDKVLLQITEINLEEAKIELLPFSI